MPVFWRQKKEDQNTQKIQTQWDAFFKICYFVDDKEKGWTCPITPTLQTIPMTPVLPLWPWPPTLPLFPLPQHLCSSCYQALTLFPLPQHSHCSHYPRTHTVPITPTFSLFPLAPTVPTCPITPTLQTFLMIPSLPLFPWPQHSQRSPCSHDPSTHIILISGITAFTPELTLFPLPQNSHCSHYPSILTVPISPTLTLCPLPQHSHCSHYPNTHTVPITPTLTPLVLPLPQHSHCLMGLVPTTDGHPNVAVPWPVPTFWHVPTIDIQYMVMCRLPDGLSQLRNLTHLGLNDVSLTRLPYDIARSVSALVHSIVASMHLLLKVAWFKCATLKMEQI